MPFTDKDREMLVKTHTTVKMMKESHERRLESLEKEDRVLHHRINKVRGLYLAIMTVLSSISAAGGAIFAYMKTKGGS